MLEVISLSKSFDTKQVLSNLSFSLPQGATHVLLGSSGSGKSTLIRLILGLIPYDSGKIQINGVSIESTPHRIWAQKIGYVPQGSILFPHLTARKNITLMAESLGWSKQDQIRRLAELGRIFSVPSDLLDRYPHQLSGGQNQRVSLMRAAFLNPDILLLDEPLGALDPILRSDVQQELRDVFRKLGKTVLLVTHDIGEAEFFGDQLILLKEGRIIQSGAFEELLKSPIDPYVTKFIKAQRFGAFAHG